MGYFDGLTEASFKTDQNGNTVFYPWGVLGKGHVLTDPAKAQQLRAFVRLYYQVTLPVVIILSILRIWLLLGLAVVGLTAWFLVRTRQLTAGAPVSGERLSMKESYRNSAARHSKPMLWALLACSLLFVVGGVWIALRGEVLVGLGSALFFGLCGLAIGYMATVRTAK
jgi:hypothetical protein